MGESVLSDMDWPTFFIASLLWLAMFAFGYWCGKGGK